MRNLHDKPQLHYDLQVCNISFLLLYVCTLQEPESAFKIENARYSAQIISHSDEAHRFDYGQNSQKRKKNIQNTILC
jgi:type I site-specific restriction-modification system R (restriction) subunit